MVHLLQSHVKATPWYTHFVSTLTTRPLAQFSQSLCTKRRSIYTLSHFHVNSGGLTEEIVEEELRPIEITVTDESGQPISGPVTLGQVLILSFTLRGGIRKCKGLRYRMLCTIPLNNVVSLTQFG